MDFMTAVRTCLQQKYADFGGRARRSEYWWFYLFAILASIVANIIDGVVIGMPVLSIVLFLGLIIPGIAVSVRRMHDGGRSGWLLLIGLIPLVGLLLLWWFIQPGTPGDNEYGPDPLAT